MERLLMLMQASSFSRVRETMAEAFRTASVPSKLTVGLLLTELPGEEELEIMKNTKGLMYLVEPGTVWEKVHRFWQGEAFVLMLSCDAVFTPSWDRELQQMQQKTGDRGILTGILPWPGDPVDAVYSIAGEKLEGRTLHFRQGVPLRYASASHLSAFLNPSFAFGPAPFFLKADPSAGPVFLQAFEDRWVLQTMYAPVLRMKQPTVLEPVVLPEGESMEHFARHFGMDLVSGLLSPEIREGIFTSDLQVKMTVPLAVKLQEGIRQSTIGRNNADPLFVTAYLPKEDSAMPDEQEMAHFRRLAAIERLTLLCFAKPGAIRKILFSHPNTLEFKPKYCLAFRGEGEADDASYNILNHFFLLAAGREKSPDHTHYVWVDFDYLGYPVYEGTALNWESICTDRVCLGRVGGCPDYSMVSVPEHLLDELCREVHAMCEEEMRKTGHLPEPDAVLENMMQKNPAWFELLDLPGRRDLLSLSMTLWGDEWGRRG
ncbi:MAG: hypothetical protein IJL88_03960 [Clostridia bacterium]|nr:hypothetical protein [Clostridia bacterium]